MDEMEYISSSLGCRLFSYHRNLVSLIGYCRDSNQLGLVYEYAARGSLRDHLSDKTGNSQTLRWRERIRIAVEAAQGDLTIIGIAFYIAFRFLTFCSTEQFMNRYSATFQLTEKSDVYSFGVVLLELVTGRSAMLDQPKRCHLVQWVRWRLAEADITEVADPKLRGRYNNCSILMVIDLAMRCVDISAHQRPTMTE
ncbi:receptor-like serine threonine-protein kinase, partial [Musa troglodytarum]